MNSNHCEKCGLIIAFLSVRHCWVGWDNQKSDPTLTEEEVLGVDKKPCPECLRRLENLAVDKS